LHIFPGSDWDTVLESALNAADSLIIVITPDSNRSLVVKAEWSYFGESGKKIFPVLLKDAEIPFRLRVLQYTDFRLGSKKAFPQLLDAVSVPNTNVVWK